MKIYISKKTGWIVDLMWGSDFPRKKLATVFCVRHLKIWPEGDLYEKYGGKACQICSAWPKKVKGKKK